MSILTKIISFAYLAPALFTASKHNGSKGTSIRKGPVSRGHASRRPQRPARSTTPDWGALARAARSGDAAAREMGASSRRAD